MLSTSKSAFSRKASRLSPSLLAVLVAGALSAFGLQGANAMELSSDMKLGEFNDDGAGLLIGPGLTFDAEGDALNVTGRQRHKVHRKRRSVLLRSSESRKYC